MSTDKIKEYYRVKAEINLDAIHENVANAKALTKPGTKLMAIIKADAYGHGAVMVAHTLEDVADAYGVAILEEGIELRQSGINKPILILGYTPAPLYPAMIKYDIATAVFEYDMAEKMSEAAEKIGKKAKVHIKLDTGMSRIGFKQDDESLEVIKKIAELPGIEIEGCFTHFATMDEKDKTKAMKQFERYMDFVERIEDVGIKIPVKHVSNSAGIIEKQEVNLDMVRDGICVYGMYPSDEVDKTKLKLTPAMEIKSYVSFVKTLEAGVEIGYGGTYITTKQTTVATIPVGYADGYSRALSNRGRVLIKGKSFPIIGRICMDQFMVDISELPEIKQGDEVTLVGRGGDEYISIEEVADMSYSFNYEFVCDIGKRIPRVYYKGGKVVATKDFYPEY
ncbi:alanine racemase [Clostridium sp. CAG:253]|nr:alanine racemase [Clostridium sp. CAG:253]